MKTGTEAYSIFHDKVSELNWLVLFFFLVLQIQNGGFHFLVAT
jgi:hypothetical protein